MSAAPKLKVSLTLSADVLALVDRDARRHHASRSGVIEQWLRRAAGSTVESDIAEATAAYYLSLRGPALREERALSHALSRASRRVAYDDTMPATAARTRRR